MAEAAEKQLTYFEEEWRQTQPRRYVQLKHASGGREKEAIMPEELSTVGAEKQTVSQELSSPDLLFTAPVHALTRV